MWTCESLSKVLEGEPGDRRLSYLPLSHIAERATSHFQQIYLGFETWFATSIDTLREDLVACKPTAIFGVPRVWEKFYAGIRNMIENLPDEQREMAEQAIQLGLKRVEAEQAGTSLPPELEAADPPRHPPARSIQAPGGRSLSRPSRDKRCVQQLELVGRAIPTVPARTSRQRSRTCSGVYFR